MQKDIKDIKEFTQSKSNEISFLQSTPKVLFNIILSFLDPSIGMLLAYKLAYDLSQKYWEKRITSDFTLTIDPSLPNLLTSFTIYRHYQILFKTNAYRTGMRLGHPLLPAYIQSRCSENDLQKYTLQSLLKMAAVVGNGLMIQWLTAPQRGYDRAIPDGNILDDILRLDSKELLKLIISAAEEQKQPLSDKALILSFGRFNAKSLFELWADEPWSGERVDYQRMCLIWPHLLEI